MENGEGEMRSEPVECPMCGFEKGTDDCTCDPWMNLPEGESRMDYLVTSIAATIRKKED